MITTTCMITTTAYSTQNCVRHCLSLGQFFRKVERAGEHTGMKGNYWEVIPGKKDMLDRDIELFMIEERKRVMQHNLRLGAHLYFLPSITLLTTTIL